MLRRALFPVLAALPLAPLSGAAADDWTVFENCEFLPARCHDGDSFPLRTRKTEAGGQSRRNRYYAFIEGDGRDLAELLVEKGFARAHGLAGNYRGRSAAQYQRLLERKERTARRDRAGLWSEAQLPR